MKKLAFGVLAAALMMIGLSAAPAQAGPYTGTVATTSTVTGISSRVPSGGFVVGQVKVTPKSGSAKVRTGYVKMICKATDRSGKRVVRKGTTTRYAGGNQRIAGPKLYRSLRWTCYVKYYGRGVYKPDLSSGKSVRVRG